MQRFDALVNNKTNARLEGRFIPQLIKVIRHNDGEEVPESYSHAPIGENQAMDDFNVECSIQAKYRSQVNGVTKITLYVNHSPVRVVKIQSNGGEEQ